MPETVTKPFYQSRTILGAIAGAIVMALAIFGIEIPGLEGQLTEVFLAIGGIVTTALTIYGRIKAAKVIGTTKPGLPRDGLSVLAFLVVVGLAVGLSACSSYELTKADNVTPAQTVFAIQADYNTALQAAVTYVESSLADPAVVSTIQRLEESAFAALTEAREAIRKGHDPTVPVAIAAAKGAVSELTRYLTAKGVV